MNYKDSKAIAGNPGTAWPPYLIVVGGYEFHHVSKIDKQERPCLHGG